MKALSVKQPWAWAIIHAGKDIDNRPRRTHHTGTIAIHGSLQPFIGWEKFYPKRAAKPPSNDGWERGAIIGFVDLVECVDDSRSKWFSGPFGYVLKNPRPLRKPIPCKGALGLWEIPPKILKLCRV